MQDHQNDLVEETEIVTGAALNPGTRVRLVGDIISVTLRSDHGSVVRRDQYDGYYVIRLDQPAIHLKPDGTTEELAEVVEYEDNLAILVP